MNVLLQATDKDLGVNGQVSYRVLHPAGFFRINSNGSIFTSIPLDREIRSQYDLIVEASDGASDPRQTTTTLSVEILDIDDNSPVFSQTSYIVNLPENSPVGTVFLQLSVRFPIVLVFHLNLRKTFKDFIICCMEITSKKHNN